jgi:hypothetical protein
VQMIKQQNKNKPDHQREACMEILVPCKSTAPKTRIFTLIIFNTGMCWLVL